MADSSKIPSFKVPLFLICEGYKDKKLLERLIQVRRLPTFSIETTSAKRDEPGGISKFSEKLRSLKFRRNKEVLTNIILVADADECATDTFAGLCDEVRKSGWGEPPLELLKPSVSKPAISIMIIPLGEQQGCMENPCAAAARTAAGPLATSIDYLLAQANKNWNANRKSKAWLRTSLAVTWKDPDIPVHQVFSEKLDRLIPVTDAAFTPIASFLASFGIDPVPPVVGHPEQPDKKPRRGRKDLNLPQRRPPSR